MRLLVMVLLVACGERGEPPAPEPRAEVRRPRAPSGDRFRDLVAELEGDPRIVVQRAFIGPPATAAALERAQRVLGAPLAPEIVDFYRRHDGVSIRWVLAADARPEDRKRIDAPFTEVDRSPTTAGSIYVMPIEQVFVSADAYRDEIWSDSLSEIDEPMMVGKRRYNELEFRKGLRPFDYYSEQSMAAFFVGGRDASPPVLLGDAHAADWKTSGSGDFTAYVDGIVALRGSVRGRRTFMLSLLAERLGWPFAVAHWRTTPPTLDLVVAWSKRSGADDDERWLADVEPLLEAARDPAAKRLLRELRQ